MFRSFAFLLGLLFLCSCAAGNSEYDLLMAQGNYNGAKRLIHRLLEEYSYRDWNPTMPARRAQLYYWLANAHAQLGEYDSLQLALSMCVTNDPEFGEARDQLLSELAQSKCYQAVAFYDMGTFGEAVAEWKTASDLVAPIASRMFQAQIHHNPGLIEAAASDTSQALHDIQQSANPGDSVSQNPVPAHQQAELSPLPAVPPALNDTSSSNALSPAPPSRVREAQTRKGVYSVSGSVSLSSGSSDYQDATMKSTSFEFAPSFSFFFVDRFELTVAPSYFTSSSEFTLPNAPPSTTDNTGLGITLGIRYYFPFETSAPFVGVGAGLSWSKSSYNEFNNSFSSPTKTYNIAVGLDYFLAESLALEPQFQYRGSERETTSSSIVISIGVKYFIL